MLKLDIAYVCPKFDDCSFSLFRDMVGAHQNLNAPRDMITPPLSGLVCHTWLALAMINLLTKFEVTISTYYENMKDDTQCQKWGGLGLLGVTQGQRK